MNVITACLQVNQLTLYLAIRLSAYRPAYAWGPDVNHRGFTCDALFSQDQKRKNVLTRLTSKRGGADPFHRNYYRRGAAQLACFRDVTFSGRLSGMPGQFNRRATPFSSSALFII
jgi:hypothetical protein